MFLQLIYISSVNAKQDIAATQILMVSQRNNRRDGITGLLYSDPQRFLQALEGPAALVLAAFERIKADPRHRAVVMLSKREVETREFGDWAMAHRLAGEDADAFLAKVDRLTASASPNVRATFQSLADYRRAA